MDRGAFLHQPPAVESGPDLAAVLATALDIAAAVAHLHAAGIVHGGATPICRVLAQGLAKAGLWKAARLQVALAYATCHGAQTSDRSPELLSLGGDVRCHKHISVEHRVLLVHGG